MHIIILSLFLIISSEVSAQVESKEIKLIQKIYQQGKYEKALEELNSWELKLLLNKNQEMKNLGLAAYWKAVCYKKLSRFKYAIFNFKKSLERGFEPEDIHYELGQSYFAAEKLTLAREEFGLSYKKKFKEGVSLYYLGFISHALGDYDEAILFLQTVGKLKDDESREVQQASEILVGDIMLEKIGLKTKSRLNGVVAQYEYALNLNETSNLAPLIQEKIIKTQREYDLRLFEYLNGRPTPFPSYLLKISQELGQDSNVTFSPAGTTVAKSKQSSFYSRTDVFGKYTFHIKKRIGLSPELRFNNTYYFNRVPEIYRNDNFLLSPALRLNHEHSFQGKQASLLLDYEYSDARRDVNARKVYEFSSKSHSLSLGEKLQLFSFGESILRVKQRYLESYLTNSSSRTTSLVVEQMVNLKDKFLFLFLNYDRMRVKSPIFNTDSLTFRGDLSLGRYQGFNPGIGFGIGVTDPINDRANRGTEMLINPSLRLSRTFNKHWNSTLRFDYQDYQSQDKTNFAYKKYILALGVDYQF